jgi:hydroxymethylpyrimidine/phosphomethylpyrimidine kinase
VVLDLQLSGPSGETVLTQRGIDVVIDRLGVPDLVIVGRSDAEPLSGGEIRSLDDAQVAAQRLVKRGAQSVVIKCGPLPARHFEAENAEAENAENADQPDDTDGPFNADLYYDGDSFALFEAPHLSDDVPAGASSAFALAALRALADGKSPEAALQDAKRYASEGLRASARYNAAPFNFRWDA